MKKYQYEAGIEQDDNYKSRSQKKRESTAHQERGEELVKKSIAQLQNENINEEVIEAIKVYNSIKHKEAKRRQMQFIGKLLREQSN